MRRALPMHRVLLLAFAALSGCASSSSSPGAALPAPDPTAQVSEVGGSFLRIRPGEAAAAQAVAFPVDRVWSVLPLVLDSLGISLGTVDPKQRVIGNSGMKLHKRLGDALLSRYIDCGQAQGFPSAETYDIHMSVLTQVQPSDSGTTITTLVEAVGRPMQFRGDYSRCSTKGELESRIAANVRARLSR